MNRALFNQLQITVKRNEKNNKQQSERLLHRRATLHTEQLTLTNLEKRKKLLPKEADPRSISPRSTHSIPSYARTTKASKLRENPSEKKVEKLPIIPSQTRKISKVKPKPRTSR